MDGPKKRRMLAKINEETLVQMALKALTIVEKDEEFVLAIIHADDPVWKPVLDKVNPDWEKDIFPDEGEGDRFTLGTFDVGFIDFLARISPEDEAEMRKPAMSGFVKVFVLGFGGVDRFFVRYDRPESGSVN